MTDVFTPAPVPELSDAWLVAHREGLLRAIDTKPPRKRRVVALAGTTAVATGVATGVLTMGAGAPYAFAGWSAEPSAPAPGQLQSAQSVCQGRLDQAVSNQPANKQPPARQPSNRSLPSGPFTAVLSDVRGPFTTSIFSDGSSGSALCLAAPGATSLRWVVGGAPVPGAGAIAVDQVSFLARDGQTYTLAEGRTGSAVTGAILQLADGSTVTATVGDGYFLAWWPGAEGIDSATLTTVSGTVTQLLNLPGPATPSGSPKTP